MLRYLTILLALIVSSPSLAYTRLVFDDGYIGKSATNLVCEVDASLGDGVEARLTGAGSLQLQKCIGLGDASGTYGSSPGANCTGICRLADGSADADRAYADLNCNAVKDLGENFLDETGAVGSGDDLRVDGVLTSTNQPNLVGIASPGASDIYFSIPATPDVIGTIRPGAVSESQLDIPAGPPVADQCLKSTGGDPLKWENCAASTGDQLGTDATRGEIIVSGGGTVATLNDLSVDESDLNVPAAAPAAGLCLKSTAGEPLDWGTCGTGSFPSALPFVVANDPSNDLSAEVKPSAAQQIPISSSSTAAAWAAPTGTAGDALFSGYQMPNAISPPLPLTNKLLRLAVAYSTFDILSFNMATTSQIVPIYTDTWSNVFGPGTGYCDKGLIDGSTYHIANTNGDCTTAPTGSPPYQSIACSCGQTDSSHYGPIPAGYGPGQTPYPSDVHFWTFAQSGWALDNDSQPYPYILDGEVFPRPVMRLQLDGGNDDLTARPGSCVAATNIGSLATWTASGRENTIHIKAQLNNPGNLYTVSGPRNKEMIAFAGWQANYQDATAGTNLILNSAATAYTNAIPVSGGGFNNQNTVGLLWYGPTMSWYSVWHRNGVSRIYLVKTFTQDEYNTFLSAGQATINYFATWTQYGIGQSSSDASNDKFAVWSAATGEAGTYTATAQALGLGTPLQNGAGYRRVMAACSIDTNTTQYNLHFMVQKMDVIR